MSTDLQKTILIIRREIEACAARVQPYIADNPQAVREFCMHLVGEAAAIMCGLAGGYNMTEQGATQALSIALRHTEQMAEELTAAMRIDQLVARS